MSAAQQAARSEDLQTSLAVALADIENKRLKLARLTAENVHLRNVLRNHDIQPGDVEHEGDGKIASDATEVDKTSADDSNADADNKHEELQPGQTDRPVIHDASILVGGSEVRAACVWLGADGSTCFEHQCNGMLQMQSLPGKLL